MEEKFVVHDVNKEITLPAQDLKIFAVIHFNGLQHKLTKDDTLILDRIEVEVGKVIVFDKVLLVGTPDYTSVGRPYVESAKVIAVVESHNLSEKIIIFKKKRRKGYQRNKGHRSRLTVVRILKIIHEPEQKMIENYHKL